MTERDDDFNVSVRHVGNTDIVVVHGELDLFTAPRLRDVLSNAGPCRAPHLVLDLSDLGYLDSVGVGTLIAGRRFCAARGGRAIVVTLPGTSVHKILHILRLHVVMEMAPSLDVAAKSIEVNLELWESAKKGRTG